MWDVKNIALVIIVVLIVGSITYLSSLQPKRIASPKSAEIPVVPIQDINSTTTQVQKPKLTPLPIVKKPFPRAEEIVSPSGFINTDKITIGELIGKKVTLVDFWTFSCINCQRTTPYLKSWYAKYKDQGLEIIGIHTPEFPFEAVYTNVKAAVEQAGIKYPVVLDNNYATWNAYGNRFWPREYLIDIYGYIVHDHIGEGAYDETEKAIQEALSERSRVLGVKGSMPSGITKPSDVIAFDASRVQSPEMYFGSARNEYLGNGKQNSTGTQLLTVPDQVSINQLYLGGKWNFNDEYAQNNSSHAEVVFRYFAKNVYLVGGSDTDGVIQVFLDGKLVGAQRGVDVKSDGTVLIKENRLYKLIDGNDYGEHTLRLIIQKPGLKAFTFTFG